jgi:hypothetical protein
MPNNYDLASDGDHGSYTPVNLLAGSTPPVTSREVTLKSGEGAFVQYEVAALEVASNKIVKLTQAVVDGSEICYCIIAQPADSTAADVATAAFVGGNFNHEALVWPAAYNTYAERVVAFADKNGNNAITIGKLL